LPDPPRRLNLEGAAAVNSI
jgi:hypothetical protein